MTFSNILNRRDLRLRSGLTMTNSDCSRQQNQQNKTMPIPTLQTERLILRAHTRDDLSAATAMWSEPVVVRYIGGKPESGWAFAPHAFGKGYATEALKAALAWGDENLKPKKTVCIIGPENLASIRVAEKCGYQKQLETTYSGEPTLLFERIL